MENLGLGERCLSAYGGFVNRLEVSCIQIFSLSLSQPFICRSRQRHGYDSFIGR